MDSAGCAIPYTTSLQHPDDYITVSEPFVECTQHCCGLLVARVCWVMPQGGYTPMSFMCNTGVPMGLYLSEHALRLLKDAGIIQEDETGTEYVGIKDVGKINVASTPLGYAPENMMGLQLLTKLELSIKEDGKFSFGRMPAAFKHKPYKSLVDALRSAKAIKLRRR